MYIKEGFKETGEFIKEKTINQMNMLFILYRGRYLIQLGKEGKFSYITTKNLKLNDYVVRQHIDQSCTIGIILGREGLTKFFTFDIDIMNEDDRKNTTLELVRVLNEYFGIHREDIHVSESGLKGYHVDLYFDNIIPEKSLLPFYQEVLSKLGESSKRIERRPTTGQGLKLPLGTHKKTGRFCQYVDNLTLKPLSVEYFLGIKQINLQDFKEFVLDDYKVDINSQIKETNPSAKVINSEIHKILDGQTIEKSVLVILKKGHLVESGSRNDFTYYASLVLKGQGHNQEDCIGEIAKVLRNTMENPETRKYINKSWSWDSLFKETNRIVKNTYRKNYCLNVIKSKEVTFYKSEIDQIMKLQRNHLKKLLFSLLLHSKIYSSDDGIFYCTYQTLFNYGNDSNRGRTKKNIKKIEEFGFIEIISSGIYIAENYCSPNYYRNKLLLQDEEEPSYTFSSDIDTKLEDIVEILQSKKAAS